MPMATRSASAERSRAPRPSSRWAGPDRRLPKRPQVTGPGWSSLSSLRVPCLRFGMTDRATPNLPARDFARTTGFYAELGFIEEYRDDGWLILRRDAVTLEFFPLPGLDPSTSSFSCCLRLDDVDGFYSVCRAAEIPETTRGWPPDTPAPSRVVRFADRRTDRSGRQPAATRPERLTSASRNGCGGLSVPTGGTGRSSQPRFAALGMQVHALHDLVHGVLGAVHRQPYKVQVRSPHSGHHGPVCLIVTGPQHVTGVDGDG